jgi:methyltransferase-like protein/2-polyprenyl-3-methyl-5-hydroxy-6-metoxy-1,4-benzoquinol methylase
MSPEVSLTGCREGWELSDATRQSYDAVLYPSYPLPQTHPDRLATLATLFGMKPAPVTRCRVLELGCGDGSNLIPMAFGLPESEFLGLDLAARPIAGGQATIEALGLKNCVLRQLDIMEVTPDWGLFDYIVAHGLYSWVPPAVRDKILAICQTHLAPQGVAYVSYNTYPGGHLRRMLREMMLFHTRNVDEPQQQIDQARAFVRFLAEGQTDSEVYSLFLKQERERLDDDRHRALLYHDDLADIQAPIYFFEFAKHAARHGLQFLSEADFFEMQDHIYPAQVSDQLRAMAGGQIVLKEQYLDFLKCRRFRQTLLCHQEIGLDRTLRPEQGMGLFVASPALPVSSEPDIGSSALEEFRGPRGAALKTNHPLAKAALCRLGEIWPQAARFPELAARAYSLLGREADPDDVTRDLEERVLAEILLGAYSAGLAELHLHAQHVAWEAGERPVASALARRQVRNGQTILTNLRHANVQVEDALGRALIQFLDGTRDRADLLRDLAELVVSGTVTLQQDSGPVRDRQQVEASIARELEPSLAGIARLALLVE